MRSRLRFVLTTVVLFSAVFGWVVSIQSAEKNSSYQAALESIRAEDLGGQIEQLADPEMEGREAGTRGGRAAADYLAEQYAKLHLRGAGDQGGFLQAFAPNFHNVLAVLEGSDPKLRDQVIVVGAHYDHVGYGGRGLSLGPYGYVHPGADDNASGTSAVLELAQAFTLLSPPPKRSVLFAAWDAEEKGMLGSKYWTSHPTTPLDHVVAAVNLDMVGRLRDDRLTVLGSRTGYGWRRLLSGQNDDVGLQLEFTWLLKSNADHYSFFDHNIPVLMVHTGMHSDYHCPSDVPQRINRSGMVRVTRLLFGLLDELADRPESTPKFRTVARYESPDTEKKLEAERPGTIDRLGVGWIEDAAATGGVLVATVRKDSPADRAGIRPGDRIVQFAGQTIRSDDDFFGAVAAARSPAVVMVRRPQEKEPLQRSVALQGEPLRWGIFWRVDDAEPGAVVLTHVVPGSPAARVGLSVGDRIYQVAGRDFLDETKFEKLVNDSSPSLQLLVEHQGRQRIVVLRAVQGESTRRAA
ncbi:MAG: M28 family peptidase [Thermoguttaceae bacterium]